MVLSAICQSQTWHARGGSAPSYLDHVKNRFLSPFTPKWFQTKSILNPSKIIMKILTGILSGYLFLIFTDSWHLLSKKQRTLIKMHSNSWEVGPTSTTQFVPQHQYYFSTHCNNLPRECSSLNAHFIASFSEFLNDIGLFR